MIASPPLSALSGGNTALPDLVSGTRGTGSGTAGSFWSILDARLGDDFPSGSSEADGNPSPGRPANDHDYREPAWQTAPMVIPTPYAVQQTSPKPSLGLADLELPFTPDTTGLQAESFRLEPPAAATVQDGPACVPTAPAEAAAQVVGAKPVVPGNPSPADAEGGAMRRIQMPGPMFPQEAEAAAQVAGAKPVVSGNPSPADAEGRGMMPIQMPGPMVPQQQTDALSGQVSSDGDPGLPGDVIAQRKPADAPVLPISSPADEAPGTPASGRAPAIHPVRSQLAPGPEGPDPAFHSSTRVRPDDAAANEKLNVPNSAQSSQPADGLAIPHAGGMGGVTQSPVSLTGEEAPALQSSGNKKLPAFRVRNDGPESPARWLPDLTRAAALLAASGRLSSTTTVMSAQPVPAPAGTAVNERVVVDDTFSIRGASRELAPIPDLSGEVQAFQTRDGAPPSGDFAFAARLKPAETAAHTSSAEPVSGGSLAAKPGMAAFSPAAGTVEPARQTYDDAETQNGPATAAPEKPLPHTLQDTRGPSTELPPPGSLSSAEPSPSQPPSSGAPPSDKPAAAPPNPPEVHLPPPPPVSHNLSFRLADDQRNVDIRIAERSGEIRVLVQTPDRELASELRDQLPELTGRLQQGGFQAETWRPSSSTSAHSEWQGGGSQGFSQGSHRDPREQQRQAHRWIGEWTTTLSSSDSEQESL